MAGAGPAAPALLLAAEVAAERLPVGGPAQGGGDPVPRPLRGTGLPHRHPDRVLGGTARIQRVLHEFFDGRRHGTEYGTNQAVACARRRRRPGHGSCLPRLGTGRQPPRSATWEKVTGGIISRYDI